MRDKLGLTTGTVLNFEAVNGRLVASKQIRELFQDAQTLGTVAVKIIKEIQPIATGSRQRVSLRVDRATLSKRRWRGSAEDGSEFGFDLAQPLANGAIFFETETSVYEIAQLPEDLLEISLGEAAHAARTGWMIGNLHFPVEIAGGVMRVPDDPAARRLLEREQIGFAPVQKIFHPLKAAIPHER